MAPEKMSLSSAEVCSILLTSASAGVSELKFGHLHVKFGRPVETQVGIGFPSYPFVPQTAPASAPVTDLTEAQHQQQAKESLEDDEIRVRQERLERAMVEDPVLFEELLRQGELSDAVDSADDEDLE